jgi:glycosyltransferase domain-containing protein
MSQNNLITVVIPTYNRPAYLKRLLGYYDECQVTHKIIIADGSSEEIKNVNRQTVSSFPKLYILHLDGYSPETTVLARILDAIKHVDTKYNVFCADDDFITPNGMKQSVEFLETNPDYTLAHGLYFVFSVTQKESGGKELLYQPVYGNESIINDNSVERFYYHLSEYKTPTFYAVYRTEFLKMVWEDTYRHSTDFLFSELLASLLALIHGKMKSLDIVYCARDSSSERVQSVPTLLDYKKNKTYNKLYRPFRECLSNHLSREAHISLWRSGKIIDKAMARYLKKSFKAKKPHRPFGVWLAVILTRLGMPTRLKNMLRKPYEKITEVTTKPRVEPPRVEPPPLPHEYEREIEIIKRHVVKWYK